MRSCIEKLIQSIEKALPILYLRKVFRMGDMRNTESNKQVTIKDIAKKAGVSQATVGRVIGGYGSVSSKAKEKVLKVVKELNYVPNSIAQSMKNKRTKTIGVVVGKLGNPFFSEIVNAIEATGAKLGYTVVISNTDEDPKKELECLRTLYSKQIDGIIIATTLRPDTVLDAASKKFYSGSIPTVYIDRELPFLQELCVLTDNYFGAYKATEYLIEMGHRNIGIIAGTNTSTMHRRIEGYKRALMEHNIEPQEKFIRFGEKATVEEGRQFTSELLNNNPDLTALFALNNQLVTGMLKTINEMKLSIPSDLSIVGWDDFELAQIVNPPLTMVTQDTEKIGTVATEKLIEIINSKDDESNALGERRIVFNAHLIIRESCADRQVELI
jgi:DNA-binding LacI/PurR family transcriptional regulator